MIEYVRQIATEVAQKRDLDRSPTAYVLLGALKEELDRLDPRDFLPDARYEFVLERMTVRDYGSAISLNSGHIPVINGIGKRVLSLLEKYGGDGSRALSRSFTFVNDAELRSIIERDYRELTLMIFPSGAWKSTVILAGSILEAILHDLLSSNPERKLQAASSSKAPRDRSGKLKSLDNDEWTLHDLIEVSVDLALLPDQRARTFDQVLRDYRNFVHPRKEIRAQHPCTEAEALMAKGALDGVCNHLSATP